MMYITAILLPPLATVIYGRWFATVICVLLFVTVPVLGLVTWAIASLIALIAVNNEKQRRFMKGQIDRVVKVRHPMNDRHKQVMADAAMELNSKPEEGAPQVDKWTGNEKRVH